MAKTGVLFEVRFDIDRFPSQAKPQCAVGSAYFTRGYRAYGCRAGL